jgi:hypothetical protein
MSWRELDAWMVGSGAKQEGEWMRTAQLGAWVLSPWSKKRLTGEDLFKTKRKQSKPTIASPEHVTELVHKLAGIPETAWQPSHPLEST